MGAAVKVFESLLFGARLLKNIFPLLLGGATSLSRMKASGLDS
jgi:hypothetical protein